MKPPKISKVFIIKEESPFKKVVSKLKGFSSDPQVALDAPVSSASTDVDSTEIDKIEGTPEYKAQIKAALEKRSKELLDKSAESINKYLGAHSAVGKAMTVAATEMSKKLAYAGESTAVDSVLTDFDAAMSKARMINKLKPESISVWESAAATVIIEAMSDADLEGLVSRHSKSFVGQKDVNKIRGQLRALLKMAAGQDAAQVSKAAEPGTPAEPDTATGAQSPEGPAGAETGDPASSPADAATSKPGATPTPGGNQSQIMRQLINGLPDVTQEPGRSLSRASKQMAMHLAVHPKSNPARVKEFTTAWQKFAKSLQAVQPNTKVDGNLGAKFKLSKKQLRK